MNDLVCTKLLAEKVENIGLFIAWIVLRNYWCGAPSIPDAIEEVYSCNWIPDDVEPALGGILPDYAYIVSRWIIVLDRIVQYV